MSWYHGGSDQAAFRDTDDKIFLIGSNADSLVMILLNWVNNSGSLWDTISMGVIVIGV